MARIKSKRKFQSMYVQLVGLLLAAILISGAFYLLINRIGARIITEIFMILLAAVWFIPIYYLIVTTFKNPQEATQSPLGLPKVWVLQN